MRRIPITIPVIIALATLVTVAGNAWANQEMVASYFGGPEDESLKCYETSTGCIFVMKNGKSFDWKDTSVAAHKELPLGTRLRLTNPENGLVHEVIVQDRGPFVQGRDLDLSKGAAQQLGFGEVGKGKAILEVEILD